MSTDRADTAPNYFVISIYAIGIQCSPSVTLHRSLQTRYRISKSWYWGLSFAIGWTRERWGSTFSYFGIVNDSPFERTQAQFSQLSVQIGWTCSFRTSSLRLHVQTTADHWHENSQAHTKSPVLRLARRFRAVLRLHRYEITCSRL